MVARRARLRGERGLDGLQPAGGVPRGDRADLDRLALLLRLLLQVHAPAQVSGADEVAAEVLPKEVLLLAVWVVLLWVAAAVLRPGIARHPQVKELLGV